MKEVKHQGLNESNISSIAHLLPLCYTDSMKRQSKKFFDHEILSYLFFGAATTLVSIVVRLFIFYLSHQELLATALGNIVGILFAFVTNDTIVFKQKRKHWFKRLVKFTTARFLTFLLDLLLTYIFVTRFPQILGYFCKNDINTINAIETIIAQVLIVFLNYVFSKVFIFIER